MARLPRLRSRCLASLAAALVVLAACRSLERSWSFLGPPARRHSTDAAPPETPQALHAVSATVAALWALPASAADDAGASSGDWFDPFVNLNAAIIEGIDGVVGSAGVAIILYTLLVKAVTFPLSQPSLRTTALLSLVSPQVEEIKRKYKDDEPTSTKLQRQLYERVGLNPFTAFVPILTQLPIFVALFRAIGKLAKQDSHFKESFLWIPSLAGPVESGKPSLDWLLKTQSSQYFEPLVGWHDAQLYLVLPAIVALTQLALTRLTASSQESLISSALFPFFIGISTLVTPQGVGVYWLTNTLLSAGQTKLVQDQIAEEFPEYKRIKDLADADTSKEEGVRYTRESPFKKENEAVAKSVAELEGKDQTPAVTTGPKGKTRKNRRSRSAKVTSGKRK